ncbi:DUF4406 domain-containing protein [Pseudomonas aeruginosa]|nr:DUF4406 domain-containing protein [Pseudomonas aeruginosa]NJC79320.1 DUF4406 domain-containing protein [Pseudomonas aeruginosa]NPX23017.1 DUF4406 domain-containing protein [Pseudomonas aeruginosa]NPX42402.1 DUF4406 domain-containing protein [Pseudomonas aeruginosa]OXU05553.1 hypothetical protein CF338_07545 [Pseudomonas aeruginosa]
MHEDPMPEAPLDICPITLVEANAFVEQHHRHHGPVQGHKFSLGLAADGRIVGVAIVGRPVARHLDDGMTLEVTRCCTDGARNGCSKLYGAAWRATRALGYHVENPAENPAPACGTWAGYMRKALAQLVTCNAIALLPGWPSSRGANIERSLAFEMGMKGVMAADIAAPIGRESAATLVCASTANSGLNQANELSHSDVGARSSGRHPLDHSVEVGSFEPVS